MITHAEYSAQSELSACAFLSHVSLLCHSGSCRDRGGRCDGMVDIPDCLCGMGLLLPLNTSLLGKNGVEWAWLCADSPAPFSIKCVAPGLYVQLSLNGQSPPVKMQLMYVAPCRPSADASRVFDVFVLTAVQLRDRAEEPLKASQSCANTNRVNVHPGEGAERVAPSRVRISDYPHSGLARRLSG